MKVPAIITSVVYHVGSMQAPSDIESRRSLEGHCLSVSRCPKAWSRIARLGGRPLWELSRKGASFIDVLAASQMPRLVEHVAAWGLEAGLAERAMRYRAWSYDSEEDRWRYSVHASREEAHQEAGGEAPPSHDQPVEPIEALVGTKALSAIVGQGALEGDDAFEYLLMPWAEEHQPRFDGLWWAESYMPEALSAPRGGILPARLERWTLQVVPGSGLDEEVASLGLRRRLVEVEAPVLGAPEARQRPRGPGKP